jgi:hypothetical protein
MYQTTEEYKQYKKQIHLWIDDGYNYTTSI